MILKPEDQPAAVLRKFLDTSGACIPPDVYRAISLSITLLEESELLAEESA